MEPEPAQNWLFFVVALVPMWYVSAFCHEFGHALLAWANGYQVSSFGLGIGRPLWVWNWGGTRVFFCRRRSTSGVTFAISRQLFPSRRKQICFIAGGILANTMLAAVSVALALWLPWGRMVWLTAAGINALMAGLSLIPFRASFGKFTLATDGALLVEILRRGGLSYSASELFQVVRGLRELWCDIDDQLSLVGHQLHAAVLWLELGDIETAQRLCRETPSLAAYAPPHMRAYEALFRGAVALGASQHADAAQHFERAQELYKEARDETGVFLVNSERGLLHYAQGEAERAVASLDAAALQPLVRHRPLLGSALLVTRLRLQAALPPNNVVEKLQHEYERIRRRNPSLVNDLNVYHALGRYYAEQEIWPLAEKAYEQAVEAARKLDESWDNEEDRSRFSKCQASLLAEAQECLRHQGKEPEAEILGRLFEAAQEHRHNSRAARERRAIRYGKFGIRLTLFNCLWAGAAGLAARTGLIGRWGYVLSVWLLFFSCPGIISWLFVWGAGSNSESPRRSVTQVMVFHGLLAWFLWLAAVVFWLAIP